MSMRILALLVAAIFLSACASLPDPKTCALIGAGAGAIGGGVAGAKHAENHDDAEGVGIGIGSMVGGAVLGYALCALLEEEPAPPPRRAAPPLPPPAPSPPPPALDPCAGRIVLRGVNFAFDRADLTEESMVILDVVAETLNQCPMVRATVGGHTDSIGTDQYNQGLSQRRADSVRRHLVGRGVAASRLETRGYGESQPIAGNDTDEGRAMNRRVELVPID